MLLSDVEDQSSRWKFRSSFDSAKAVKECGLDLVIIRLFDSALTITSMNPISAKSFKNCRTISEVPFTAGQRKVSKGSELNHLMQVKHSDTDP